MTQINAARSEQNLETLHLNESFIFDQWTFQKHLIQIYNLNHNVFFLFLCQVNVWFIQIPAECHHPTN